MAYGETMTLHDELRKEFYDKFCLKSDLIDSNATPLVDWIISIVEPLEKEIERLTNPEQPLERIWCRYAKEGRGDCEHFVGLPKVENEETTDEYGIPHGWCEYCWSQEKRRRLEAENAKLKQDIESCKIFHDGYVDASEKENAELKERVKAGNDCLDVELDKRKKSEDENIELKKKIEGLNEFIDHQHSELEALCSDNTAEWKSAAFQKVRRLLAENTKLLIENDGLKVLGEMYGNQVKELREWIHQKDIALRSILGTTFLKDTEYRKLAKAALALGKEENNG